MNFDLDKEELEKIIIELAKEKSKIQSNESEIKKHTWEGYGSWFGGIIAAAAMISTFFVNYYEMKNEINLQKNQIAELIVKDQVFEKQETDIAVLKERIKNIIENCELKPGKRSELDKGNKPL